MYAQVIQVDAQLVLHQATSGFVPEVTPHRLDIKLAIVTIMSQVKIVVIIKIFHAVV